MGYQTFISSNFVLLFKYNFIYVKLNFPTILFISDDNFEVLSKKIVKKHLNGTY